MKNNYLIVDEEYEDINEKFNKFLYEINSDRYNSIFDENNREIKIKRIAKITYPIEKVFNALLEVIIHSMNSLIDINEVSINKYFRSSNKNKNIIFKIEDFEKNHLITIIWISSNQLSKREYILKSNKKNSVTKIIFLDTLKGMDPILGVVNFIKKKIYIKSIKKAFNSSIIEIKSKIM